MRSPRTVVAAALSALAVLPGALSGQKVDSAFKGSVLERLAARRDSTFHYAAYIPKGYTGDRPVPLLLVLDPLGRAVPSLELTIRAAERLGWVVMSSYDTRGDVANAPNEKAVNLMLDDAFQTFRVDTSRLYLAGFSGLARDTWVFAYGAGGHVAGIISASAAMPGDTAWRHRYGGKPPYDAALTAGSHDFNYDEVFNTVDTLRTLGAGVRADAFDGAHQWPPEPVMAQVMGWLDARAMARGLAPMDSTLVDSLFGVDSMRAEAAVDSARAGEATLRWENAAAAWRGLHDVTSARAADAALLADPRVARWRAEHDSLQRATVGVQQVMSATLTGIRQHPGVPDLRKLSDALHIAQFEQWAADRQDSVRASWADRRLSDLYVQVSFYEPEAYLGVADPTRALSMLAVAEMIRPKAKGLCRERARAYALRRDADLTITELKCALAAHEMTLAEVRADPRYQFMRTLDAFIDLITPPGG